jgi:hypothetical protein
MNIDESAVREELEYQLAMDPEGMVDLTKLGQAAGRPRRRSPLKWVTWVGLNPGVTALGGSQDEVWADQATARDYAHSLDPRIERGRISLAQLRKRGWSRQLVQRLLPEWQATMTNPHYKTSPRIKLFSVARVEAIEATEEFQAAREDRKPRTEAVAQAIVARKVRIRKRLERITIAVPRLDWEALIEKASRQHQYQGARPAPPTDDAPPERLDQTAVNYLRRVITLNHRYVADRQSRIGLRLARREFTTRVLVAIAETYPALQSECDRQRRALEMKAQWNDR